MEETQQDTVGYEKQFSDLVSDLEDIAAELMDDLPDHSSVQKLADRVQGARGIIDSEGSGDDEGGDSYPESIFPDSMKVGESDVAGDFHLLERISREALVEENDTLDEKKVEEFGRILCSLQDQVLESNWTHVTEILEEMREESDRFMETAGSLRSPSRTFSSRFPSTTPTCVTLKTGGR